LDRRCYLELILVRHADAEEHSSDGTDGGRRLSALGEEQAEQTARALKKLILSDGLAIWYSPKERTRQTALALQAQLQASQFVALDALATGHFAHVQFAWQEAAAERVCLVGHQPFLGDWVADLSGVRLPIAKASVTLLHAEHPTSLHYRFLGYLEGTLLTRLAAT
jgi:phosphohistidine phosphatase